MTQKVRKGFRGTSIQVSVYLPNKIYEYYNKYHSLNGYSSCADFMRGALRTYYLANRNEKE